MSLVVRPPEAGRWRPLVTGYGSRYDRERLGPFSLDNVDANPGQTLAVLEMLIGQLFLVTAVARVVSAWQPGQGLKPPSDHDGN